MDESLRYDSNTKRLIERLRNKEGYSVDKIITVLTRGEVHEDVRKYARAFAPLLGISELEFVRRARPVRKGR